jgi:hypothetical protein
MTSLLRYLVEEVLLDDHDAEKAPVGNEWRDECISPEET